MKHPDWRASKRNAQQSSRARIHLERIESLRVEQQKTRQTEKTQLACVQIYIHRAVKRKNPPEFSSPDSRQTKPRIQRITQPSPPLPPPFLPSIAHTRPPPENKNCISAPSLAAKFAFGKNSARSAAAVYRSEIDWERTGSKDENSICALRD